MKDSKWLEEYGGQSTEELIALEGQYRTDSLALAFAEAVGQKSARLGDVNLSNAERVILAIQALEREVNNGGYSQFFTNSSYEFTPIIVDALNAIGCLETAAITQDAINALGIQSAITGEAVVRIMDKDDDKREDKLDACDLRYYGVVGDLSEPLLSFIKANKHKIDLNE